MNLSYKIIKNNNISHINKPHMQDESTNILKEQINLECIEILEKAKLESEQIIKKAKLKSLEIEKTSYENGYNQGLKNGYEDGYKQVYKDTIEDAKLKSEEIINKASETLFDINNKVSSYINTSREDILDLSITISKKIVGDHFKSPDSMNFIIEDMISKYEDKENILIRVNPLYKDSLEDELNNLKNKFNLDNTHIVIDNNLDEGAIILARKNGTITLDSKEALELLKQNLIGETNE